MRRFLKAICIFLSLAFAFTAVTFCWFSQDELVNLRDDFGSAKASYFKSGNGSKSNKYVIASATHFYNFAWLQYLGYFNHGKNGHNGRYQSYFEIDASLKEIDLRDLNSALPPIGTAEYPFIGNFEGNGVVIKNYTVSNEESALTKRPSAANFKDGVLALRGDGTQEVSTVGLFGITGDKDGVVLNDYGIYSETNQTGIFKDTANSQTAVPDAGVDKDEAYYSAMSVSNFYADDLSVNSVSANTLVGLAAGYANAAIEKVGVYRCGITVNANADGLQEGEAISKYSLLGDFNSDVVSWGEIASSGGTSGDDNAWGGSIDMRTLNRRLEYILGKSGQIKGWNTTISDGDNMLYILAPSAEYDWDSTTLSGYQTAYLADNTLLPLNVNMAAMGLDSLDVSSEGNSKEISSDINNNSNKLNKKYKEYSTEQVDPKNTGYIVGGGELSTDNDKGAYIRARIQALATGSSSESGIYKSQGFATYGNGTQKYSKEKFVMLTMDVVGNTYMISDSVNNAKKTNDVFSSTDNIAAYDSSTLNFDSNGKLYLSVRENFDAAMEGAYVIHGFHFMNQLSMDLGSGTNRKTLTVKDKATLYDGKENVLYSSYEFMKGGLNFTLVENGVIKAILGACYGSSQNTIFDLYKVNRTISVGGTSPKPKATISSVERIAKIYKNTQTNEIAYNTKPDGDEWKLVFDFDLLTKKECLENGAAYYFEIPVLKGDYVIGADTSSSSNNAYLMYLDIGANGSGDSGGEKPEQKPYSIATLDFVNSTSDREFSKAYADVTAEIKKAGTANSSITFERLAGSGTNENGEINTAVYYVLTNFNVSDVVFTPDNLSTSPKSEE